MKLPRLLFFVTCAAFVAVLIVRTRALRESDPSAPAPDSMDLSELRMYDIGRIVERFGIPQDVRLAATSAEYQERWNAVQLLIGDEDEYWLEWQGRAFIRTWPEAHRRIEYRLRRIERLEDVTRQLRPIIGPIKIDDEPREAPGVPEDPDLRETVTLVYDVLDFKDVHAASKHPPPIDFPLIAPRVPTGTYSPPYTGEDSIDALLKTLQTKVDTDSWRDNGGQVGVMKELFGLLVVTQTPENQLKIQLVLRNLREAMHRGEKPRPLPHG